MTHTDVKTEKKKRKKEIYSCPTFYLMTRTNVKREKEKKRYVSLTFYLMTRTNVWQLNPWIPHSRVTQPFAILLGSSSGDTSEQANPELNPNP